MKLSLPQLTRRGALLLALTALPLAAAGWVDWALWAAGVWLALVGAALLADWQLSPGPDAWELTRIHDDRLSLAAWNRVEVRIRLRRGLRDLPVWLRDETPAAFRVSDAQRILHGVARPAAPLSLVYVVYPPRRGDYAFGDLHLRWETVLGLLRRQARFPAEKPVKVYPNLVDVKKYDLLLRKNRLWELGLRTTRLLGSGSEFERLREYSPDDEYRRINWKATARRGKPVTMEYQTERSQNLVALLDVGRMMRAPVGDVAKMDYAINAVLLLTYVAAQKGDRVGVLTFADEVQSWLTPRSGKAQFHRMLELLYRVQGQPVEPDYNRAFSYFAARHSRRALVLVFTDLTASISNEALLAQMTRLRRTHLPLLVTMRDPTVERMAHQPIVDSASLHQRTVAETLLRERDVTLEALHRRGVLTLDVPADKLSIAVIERYLAIKARMMI